MLVQKKGITKSTKNLLIILGIIILLGGGYFAFSNLTAKSSDDESVLTNSDSIVTQIVKTNLDTDIFDNPQFQKLARDEFSGFVKQAEGISLSTDNPISITDVSVVNPKVGSNLIIFWKQPEFINFDRVVIYRSTSAGQLGEEIASFKMEESDSLKVGSYSDQNLLNDKKYYYFVESKIGDEKDDVIEAKEKATVLNGKQVSGIPTDETSPASAINVQVSGTAEGAINISWLNPDDQDLGRINIYRSSEKGTLGSLINSITAEKFEEYVQTNQYMLYVDEDISANMLYYYTLTTEDKSGNESSTDVLTAPYKSYFYNPFQPIDF